MESTLSLFRHLYDHLPPLFPDPAKQKMKEALESLEKDAGVTLDEVERVMIKFGYEVWPWNQAYREFLASVEKKVGEHFLLPKLSKSLAEKYKDFKMYGGSLQDLHSGRPAAFFSSDERVELCEALVAYQQSLREYTDRELKGMEKDRYLERVNDFLDILEDIRNTLNDLRLLADREDDHPILAAEIRSQVQNFEHGLCLLGPELNYDAVCQAPDFFSERKLHLNRMRGIHLPSAVDFYAN